MINLRVDECYAFDYLSILEIKSSFDKTNKVKIKSYMDCYDFLCDQMSKDLVIDICKSEEYINLKNSNISTFSAVSSAKLDLIPASKVDQCNYDRYICKQKLQEKFFGGKMIEEKVGY